MLRLLAAATLLAAWPVVNTHAAEPEVVVATLNGTIDPITDNYIARALDKATGDHANALIRQVADRLGVKSERVAEERERVIEAWDGDRDVMQRAESHRRGGT